jgi:hypothetical protein
MHRRWSEPIPDAKSDQIEQFEICEERRQESLWRATKSERVRVSKEFGERALTRREPSANLEHESGQEDERQDNADIESVKGACARKIKENKHRHRKTEQKIKDVVSVEQALLEMCFTTHSKANCSKPRRGQAALRSR